MCLRVDTGAANLQEILPLTAKTFIVIIRKRITYHQPGGW
ncbi:hypothetical protein CLOSTASPAR_04071 [[Clostridium] asparagiforme DSM 15981]|uniref:Uncharacterized protein n=1 Tax=[Clostridium] asparagiforme DSM 15981 TaxID=518636 RepID=C0D477_9FIRM|nr:hypothetical protein CLOSTASPAR_04071 [[Clostridium] asparagiforme DSM 15981]